MFKVTCTIALNGSAQFPFQEDAKYVIQTYFTKVCLHQSKTKNMPQTKSETTPITQSPKDLLTLDDASKSSVLSDNIGEAITVT